jgi:indole-3-glycerol phosphate synthase
MQGTRETGTILDRILAQTAVDVEQREQRISPAKLEQLIEDLPAPPSLREAVVLPGLSVIAEIKRASPSKGTFPVDVDPPFLASDYIAGGADAISVLTDEPFFKGSLEDLQLVATVAHQANRPVPILRKDFILGRYQMLEARAYGASAVLLIVAALEQSCLEELIAAAADFELDALVEVHDESEMERASDAGAMLIGINNRDLHTFDVDLVVSERLAGLAPPEAALVGESGIFTGEDAARMAAAGMQAILVGESLMLAEDRAKVIQELKRGAYDAGSHV